MDKTPDTAAAPPTHDAFVAVGATRFDGTVQTQETLDAAVTAWTAEQFAAATVKTDPAPGTVAAQQPPEEGSGKPVVDDLLVPMGEKLSDGRTQNSTTIIEIANNREAARIAEQLALTPPPVASEVEVVAIPVGALQTYDGRDNPTSRAVDPHDDEISVYTPKAYTLHLDDGTPVSYGVGTPKMPRSHALHWYSIANGVKPA